VNEQQHTEISDSLPIVYREVADSNTLTEIGHFATTQALLVSHRPRLEIIRLNEMESLPNRKVTANLADNMSEVAKSMSETLDINFTGIRMNYRKLRRVALTFEPTVELISERAKFLKLILKDSKLEELPDQFYDFRWQVNIGSVPRKHPIQTSDIYDSLNDMLPLELSLSKPLIEE